MKLARIAVGRGPRQPGRARPPDSAAATARSLHAGAPALRSALRLVLATAMAVGASGPLHAAPVDVPDPAAWARLTPEQQEAQRAELRQQLQRASPGERAAFRQALRERLEDLSPQQRRALAGQVRERWQQLPPEQRERLVRERREQLQSMSPRERRQLLEQRRQMLDKLTPEERDALRQKLPER